VQYLFCEGDSRKEDETMTRTIGYYVDITIKVDHPEKRDETYRVRTVHTVNADRFTESFTSAVSVYGALDRGEDDFASEYVSRVAVWSATSDGTRGRKVRKTVRRYRAADGTMFDDSTPERADAMRNAEARDYVAAEKQAA
jgi:hypothetical protein